VLGAIFKFGGFFIYWLHYILILLACVQFPLVIPLVLLKMDRLLPEKAYVLRDRLDIYFELLHSND